MKKTFIDAEEICKECREGFLVATCEDCVIKEHKSHKAVDAVEVVRCKDCKWRNTAGCPYMNFDAADREDSDFCSDGERREDDA